MRSTLKVVRAQYRSVSFFSVFLLPVVCGGSFLFLSLGKLALSRDTTKKDPLPSIRHCLFWPLVALVSLLPCQVCVQDSTTLLDWPPVGWLVGRLSIHRHTKQCRLGQRVSQTRDVGLGQTLCRNIRRWDIHVQNPQCPRRGVCYPPLVLDRAVSAHPFAVSLHSALHKQSLVTRTIGVD